MYLKRKIDQYLDEWKKNDQRLPLIVRGMRQVGKTEAILHFAKENYKNIIYINFITSPIYNGITQDGYDCDNIIKNISRINTNVKFTPKDTLIFFDEIQSFPDITTSLKFFAIDGRFDVICSGSLLGVNYKTITSVSVGYKMDYELKSMDFEEFLWSKGYNQEVIEDIYNHMKNCIPFSELEMNIYHKVFMEYVITGGMPRVVADYVTNQTFEGVLEKQRQIILDYNEDIIKYAEGMDKARIRNVLKHVPIQLAKENKKFQLSKIEPHGKRLDYYACIDWLVDAGIVNICYCLNFPELPLNGNYSEDKYKLYISDTGLLISMLDDEAQDDLRINDNLGVYKGALYENVVAEALVKSGAKLFYYKRSDSILEQDFFLRTKDCLIPIEVKSKDGNSKSMKTLLENKDKYPDIGFGIKLCYKNIGFNGKVYTFPYFTSFLIKRFLSEK